MRPMLVMHHPGFSCPLCRTFADLESDVEVEAIPEPAQLSAPAITAGTDGTGRPAVVLEDGAGEDLAMRDDEHEHDEQRGQHLGDITHAEEGSAEGFEEEVEAMVTSENEREERARGARSGSGSGSGSGTRQSSRARGEDEQVHRDDDHSEEEDELEDDGEDLGLNGEGADLATAYVPLVSSFSLSSILILHAFFFFFFFFSSTPLNGTFLSLIRQNIPSSTAHSLPPPANVSTPNSTAEEFEDASSDMDIGGGGGEGIAVGSGAVAIPAGPSTRSRTASRLGGVVGKRKR